MNVPSPASTVDRFPHWLRDIDAHLPISAGFVLHGNIRDNHLVPDGPGDRFQRTIPALWALLATAGYQALLVYDPVAGLSDYPATPESRQAISALGSQWQGRLGKLSSPEALTELIHTVQAPRPARPIALVIDYVSQFRPTGEPLSEELHAMFRAGLYRANIAGRIPRTDLQRSPLYNPVFWIVDRPSDLPGWMIAADDTIHQVPIPTPNLDCRARAANNLAAGQAESGFGPMSADDIRVFATHTEGMTLRAMYEILILARDRSMRPHQIDDAIRMYRVGLLENPWQQNALKDEIIKAEHSLGHRVLGQPGAIRRSLDILMRSTTGLTAAHSGGRGTGPRGVLFFAGPTGVGKTELAKALTAVVFGNEDAYIRFDMSEFSNEGSDLRLIGSPPGYVGHEAGGELTNAIRQRPFSLVLFDEIEKADQKIMDKFLQILSDGRLTDGSGGTVHFSEALIVFTSNKGMSDPLADGTGLPQPDITYEQLDEHVRAAITRHFTQNLGRPEILNRIGDNIVVFDYIRPDTANHLLDMFLRNTVERVRTLHSIDVEITETARTTLERICCSKLDMGGRGIGQMVESALINPLARTVFSHEDPAIPIVIEDVKQVENGTWSLILS